MYTAVPVRGVRHAQKNRSFDATRIVFFLMGCILLYAIIRIFFVVQDARPSAISEVVSGFAGYCIDDYHDGLAENTPVDIANCNGRPSQQWTVSSTVIRHGTRCLSAQEVTGKIVLDACNGTAGQTWVRAIDGYENPSTAKCLDAPQAQSDTQLVLGGCNVLTEVQEAWSPSQWSRTGAAAASTACNGTVGQRVACEAARQWVLWQSRSTDHNQLLNAYTDGNGYEEWCADFVSYVYQQAGHPFTAGERDGWDEYLATNIQNMGFVLHAADGSYIPQPGDIAFFDYNGGHVEIVAIGGSKPLFIYGDASATDPATGNGEMTENTITSDGDNGQVLYYLSPT